MSGAKSRAVEAGELKALVRQLVKAAGGVEACGVELGVSAERVSQYQRPSSEDQMPLLMINRLEAVVGRAVVTGALAAAVEASKPTEKMDRSAVDIVGAAAALIGAVHEMDRDGYRDAGEIRTVQERAGGVAREGLEALIAATQMTVGPVQ